MAIAPTPIVSTIPTPAPAAGGWSPERLAARLLEGFDRDRDGVLVDAKLLGIRFGSELRSSTSSSRYGIGLLYGRPDDPIVRVVTHTTWGLDALMQRADVNHDGVATREEIAAALRGFDRNGDGSFDQFEVDEAWALVGPRSVWTTRDVVPLVTRSRRR